MGKPYKLDGETGQTSEASSAVKQANVGRTVDGKFAKLERATHRAVAHEAKEDEVTVAEASRAARVPEKAVGSDTPKMVGRDAVYEDSIPWPEAGPTNDAARPPFKLRKD